VSEPSVRKTYQEKLRPTPTQERALEAVLWRCRTLYNSALEQRVTWWRRGQGRSATRFQQEAELKAIREAFPEYGALHSHVLQDVLARLDKTYQAFFRRLAAGEKKAGFPRFQGRAATTPSPTRSMATVPGWTTALWCCPRSGASRCAGRGRWQASSRPSR
jgi:transposase